MDTFERTRALGDSKCKDGEFYPKFLSDRRLFELQIVDPRWREVILVELAIFMQHLLSYSAQEAFKPPSAKALTISLLNSEQVPCETAPLIYRKRGFMSLIGA